MGIFDRIKTSLANLGREAQARSAAKAGARPTPAKRGSVARAGGYSAPIDTTEIDPEMQETLSIKRAKKPTRRPA